MISLDKYPRDEFNNAILYNKQLNSFHHSTLTVVECLDHRFVQKNGPSAKTGYDYVKKAPWCLLAFAKVTPWCSLARTKMAPRSI